MSVSVKRFNICLPKDLVCSLDAAAKTEYVSRSAYIREAIELRIRLDEHITREVSNTESYSAF